ncbi:hypothetical protein [Pseudogulbenkiania subflava]|uniref:Uncharacterized protein n=1 Tax=Pseudogulbenkiania subflava DSM 22618 TaxID=1123014 RepID=A0A1Y6BDS0_9NEIS|nr:hypothetical protein [Pseudogulbenkiania subflava]SMF04052.1 hypothetical protein SAMN02745746_00923 [Pseudogulbenkiania subflava DSM 22618]
MSDDYSLAPFDEGGDLQPYQPDTPLVPTDSEWLVPTPDFLSEHQSYADAPVQIFGADFPGSPQQAQQGINQLADAFVSDAAYMRLDPALANIAANWLKSSALLPMGHVEKRHKYNLEGFHIPKADMPAVTSFANTMWRAGAPQRFVVTALWWLNEVSKKAQQQPQPTAGEISDKEWDQIERRAEQDRQAGENELRTRWGFQFATNMRVVRRYFAGLSAIEREHFENAILPGGQLALNNADVVEMLYKQAIGANNLPSGGALAAEIAQIENLMRTDRKKYLSDERLQARLRELYTARDGG